MTTPTAADRNRADIITTRRPVLLPSGMYESVADWIAQALADERERAAKVAERQCGLSGECPDKCPMLIGHVVAHEIRSQA